jgi:class 3 adenylate cyclase
LNDGKANHPPQGDDEQGKLDRPIADLFTDCTVMFADIAGFTAWSSARSPTQVFTLLETIYAKFDKLAEQRGVFKVETIGDSYVAATGLPEPRRDHALVMVKFARDCRYQMSELTRDLEKTLGPDTRDLKLRFGLHSGPVTAGVLRGQKSRFQLFGDTVNTAARMESNGIPNKIHVSQTTADLLVADGKSGWVTARDELVMAKGKGALQTYWVEPKLAGTKSAISSKIGTLSSSGGQHHDEKTLRLIDWHVDILSSLIKAIESRRAIRNASPTKKHSVTEAIDFKSIDHGGNTVTILDEVVEIIELPDNNDAITFCNPKDSRHSSMDLGPQVKLQIREYVSAIATLYRDNPFHNFEHASHVAMSVSKLWTRISIPPDRIVTQKSNPTHVAMAPSLHDPTYGIASDPLTQFTCVFAALIHDVDHPGVPNHRLVQENDPLAVHYKGKSVAEQNSIEIAWNLLAEPAYQELRTAICPTEDEKKQFRQLLVNSIMATDIMDKDLKTIRNNRWDRVFSFQNNTEKNLEESARDKINRKATIVIEHLIQASDVAHTMQHWQ